MPNKQKKITYQYDDSCPWCGAEDNYTVRVDDIVATGNPNALSLPTLFRCNRCGKDFDIVYKVMEIENL
jgi:transcription elongation factor Elf1